MTDGHEICRHCGHRIERDAHDRIWIHNIRTPNEQIWAVSCGDEYGTDAEPVEQIQ